MATGGPLSGPVTLLKRKRTSVPRSSAGCGPCRLRHLRCDEKRPACLRCIQAYRTCNYPPLERPNHTTGHGKGAIADIFNALPVAAYNIPFSIPGSRDERMALHYFSVCTAPDLEGLMPSHFWDRHVFQRCQGEPCVRLAAIALGRVHLEYVTAESLKKLTLQLTPETVRAYSRAVTSLQRHIDYNGPSAREGALMCCALLYCLETMRGRGTVATSHLEKGVRLMRILWYPSGQVTSSEREEMTGLIEVFKVLDLKDSMLRTGLPWVSEQTWREPTLYRELPEDSAERSHPNQQSALDRGPEAVVDVNDAKRQLLDIGTSAAILFSRLAAASGSSKNLAETHEDLERQTTAIERQLNGFDITLRGLESRLRSNLAFLLNNPRDISFLSKQAFVSVMRLNWSVMRLSLDEITGSGDATFETQQSNLLHQCREIIEYRTKLRAARMLDFGKRSFSPDLGIASSLSVMSERFNNPAARLEARRLLFLMSNGDESSSIRSIALNISC